MLVYPVNLQEFTTFIYVGLCLVLIINIRQVYCIILNTKRQITSEFPPKL